MSEYFLGLLKQRLRVYMSNVKSMSDPDLVYYTNQKILRLNNQEVPEGDIDKQKALVKEMIAELKERGHDVSALAEFA